MTNILFPIFSESKQILWLGRKIWFKAKKVKMEREKKGKDLKRERKREEKIDIK